MMHGSVASASWRWRRFILAKIEAQMSQDAKAFGRTDADIWSGSGTYSITAPSPTPSIIPWPRKPFPRSTRPSSNAWAADGAISLLFQEIGLLHRPHRHGLPAQQPPHRRPPAPLRHRIHQHHRPPDRRAFSRFLDACALTHANPGRLRGLPDQPGRAQLHRQRREPADRQGRRDRGDPGHGPRRRVPRRGQRRRPAWRTAPQSAAPEDTFDDLAMKVVLGHLTAQEMTANLGILKMLESPSALPDALLKATAGQVGNEAAALQAQPAQRGGRLPRRGGPGLGLGGGSAGGHVQHAGRAAQGGQGPAGHGPALQRPPGGGAGRRRRVRRPPPPNW